MTFKIFNEEQAEHIADFLGENYKCRENGVLTLNGVDVDNDYSLYQKLHENNIDVVEVAYCKDIEDYSDDFTMVYSRHGNFYVHNIDYNEYFQCSDCGEFYDNTYDVFETSNGDICEDCRYENYTTCSSCDTLVHHDYIYYCEECDQYFCEDCWQDHYHEENLLYDYHAFNDWKLHHLDNETPKFYIGHELEIDNGDDMEDAVETIKNIGGVCMHDGSLSYKGIEFISHPLSYKYMLSKEEDYRKAFEHLANLGYKSHNTDTCGLHFHVTRPQNSQVIDRIILFMETYKEEIIALSRRKSEELNRWSRFLSDKRTTTNPKIIKSLDYIVNNKDTCDRYQALNLRNTNTIEFRFFKGTLKYETFMADFEFIYNLVDMASDLDIPVEDITWTRVTSKGKYLPQYIEEHNLKTDKPLIDYSKEMIVEFNKDKSDIRIEVDNLVAELLKNISNKARTKNNTAQKLRETAAYINKMNDNIMSLQNVIYNLENLDMFNYNSLDDIKADVRYIKERLGR